MNKPLLLACFVFNEKIKDFIKNLEIKFGVKNKDIFYYEILNVNDKKILTFKIIKPEYEFLDIKKNIPNSLTIHKKGETLYTINGINKYIDIYSGVDTGNIEYKSVIIDWGKIQNKFILIKDDELKILNIKRIC